MFADCAQDDDADAAVCVQCLEGLAKLVALGHVDRVEGWAVQDDVASVLGGGYLDAEAVGGCGGGLGLGWGSCSGVGWCLLHARKH